MKPKKIISNKTIIELKNQGMSAKEIANELDISVCTVYKRIRLLLSYGIKFDNKDQEKKEYKLDELDKQIIELSNQGYSNVEMSKVLGRNPATISNRIKKFTQNGIEYLRYVEKIEMQNNQILELRKQGLKLPEISEKLNMSISTISYRIKSMRDKGIDVKKTIILKDYSNIDVEIANLRKQGYLEREIAEKLKMNISKVSERLKLMQNYGMEFYPKNTREIVKDDLIIQMRKEGFSISQIAKKFKVTKDAIAKRIRKMRCNGINVDKVEIKVEKGMDEIDNKILELRRKGLLQREISSELKLSQKTISSRLMKMRKMDIDTESEFNNKLETKKAETSKIKGRVSEKKLTKAIANLIESKNATEGQIKVISEYYGVDFNSVLKLSKYIDER